MKLRRPPRSPHSETIITLIDVVFFLLVFFMLIGRMDATAPFDVTPPVAVSGQDMPTGGLTVSVSQTGDLAFAGVTYNLADLATVLKPDSDSQRLRINAHSQTPTRHVLPLMTLGEDLGFAEVVLVVTPEAQP
ncbi:biopolymer transporter ExbD [Epibacterium sp. SM1979]|uniref:Biopolymer transporter ExbD n=1 Tax=Tritonibacter litoralis TaxID=2662264 RepID=A0A843YLL6_9RHOB|nr:biopolymer transporter ExbD [Tritonibacter litoralis]MQQ10093.1 biopolymer transporter ExbD [Tritonibacter litoralis]